MADPADDALREVRARLDEAHAAADRLVQEAQQRRADETAAESPPPRGWEAGHHDATSDLRALLALLESVRDAVPSELSRRLATALRDLLLAMRALIDWYLERLGEPPSGSTQVDVEDIPLD